ncbi:DEAD/DEAH box helicase [[Mycoplasma] cavipharyngis]|uniref:DEAD/DEAH box helicase family protein n=1 Tax=[Mycoplasma] cavipharyngis TaxID=92757 RepID=UPI003703F125
MKLNQEQEKAVKILVEKYIFAQDDNLAINVYFKAPTGSGKTFIIANVIDRIIKHVQINNKQSFNGENKKLFFIYATISNAELPKQVYHKFYYQYANRVLQYLSKDQITLILSPSAKTNKSKAIENYEFAVKENHLFICGSAAFRKNTIYSEQQTLTRFLQDLKNQNYDLIYIRDEAHIGDKTNKKEINEFEQHFEYQVKNVAKYVIQMTATPKSYTNLVELEEKNLFNCYPLLIKKKQWINQGIGAETEIDDLAILELAIKQFIAIQKQYSSDSTGILNGINPAMLIQVSDRPSKLAAAEKFDAALSEIKKQLDQNNLTWIERFDQGISDHSQNLGNVKWSDVSENNSLVQVIIFKVGPSVGWDIPRACMLVQLRKVCSETLKEQTIGRIKRFPNPMAQNIPSDHIAHEYFIYSNVIWVDKNQRYINYTLKSKFENEKFYQGKIIYDQKIENISENIEYLDQVEKVAQTISKRDIEKILKEYRSTKNNELASLKIYQGNLTNNEGISVRYIETKIFNLIELELFNLHMIEKNQFLFNPSALLRIKNVYQNFLLKNDQKYHYQLFFYTLIIYKLKDLRNYYHQLKHKINQVKNYQLIESSKLLPQKFQSLKKEPLSFLKIKSIAENIFAYKTVENNEHTTIVLDSSAEEKFFNALKNILSKEVMLTKCIEIWTRNFPFEGISLEYQDDIELAKISYPDFVLKIFDHYIYIEVKSINDIDELKTNNLKKAYRNYINQKQYAIKNNKLVEITLLICKVKELFNQEVTLLCYGASTIDSVDQLLFNQNCNQEIAVELTKILLKIYQIKNKER